MRSTLRYDWSMIDRGAADGKSLLNETSWFRDTPHYWAQASLRFAYALACVEVVSRSSEKTEILYNKPVVIQAGLYLLTTGQTWVCPHGLSYELLFGRDATI